MDAEVFNQFGEQLDRFVRERLIPAESEVIAADAIPESILEDMRELGLFALSIPEAYGGAGMTTTQYAETIRRLAYAMPAYRSIISIGTGIVCSALIAGGTESQKAVWLPRLAAGAVASFALTEPGSGSDSAAMQAMAEPDGKGWVLNGTKRYITNAPIADFALVMARTTREQLPRNAHVSGFLVPLDTIGVTVGKPDEKMGQAGSQIADIILDEVRLPAAALLGEQVGRGFEFAMRSLDKGRVSVGAAATGYARRALDSAVRYATERKAFGASIAQFQLIQAMLAESEIEIYAAETMLRDVTARIDAVDDASLQSAAFKVFASEMCGRVVDRVVQVYGGAGYLADYDAERFYRDARIYRIYEGTTQILQLQIAKWMLRRAAAAV